MTPHAHRFRIEETPLNSRYLAGCACGETREYPVDPRQDFNVKKASSINGVPLFMRPFEWDSTGPVKGQRDRDYTRKEHDQDDDSE